MKTKLKTRPKKQQPKKSKPKAVKVKAVKVAKARAVKGISASSFGRFADMLIRKRQDILHMVKQKDSDVSTSDIGDELDVASQTFEREMMFELSNGERVVLDDIEAALRKIEKNDFGICESCHKKIPAARLRAMPWARYCIECQSRSESQRI